MLAIFGIVKSVFDGIAAIPAIAGYVEQFAAAVTAWYVQRQTAKQLQAIADAAAMAARAETEDDRYAASKNWVDTLSKPRYS